MHWKELEMIVSSRNRQIVSWQGGGVGALATTEPMSDDATDHKARNARLVRARRSACETLNKEIEKWK